MFEEFCDNYLRHSEVYFNPKMLEKLGITYYFGTQEPGDLVITFPGGLHMGYNMGTNLAEVSFGTQHQILVTIIINCIFLFRLHHFQLMTGGNMQ